MQASGSLPCPSVSCPLDGAGVEERGRHSQRAEYRASYQPFQGNKVVFYRFKRSSEDASRAPSLSKDGYLVVYIAVA